MTNVLLSKRGSTNLTARNLRRALIARGVSVRATPDENIRGNYKLIRWGNSDRVRFIARNGMLNERENIAANTNKLTALNTMAGASVPIPPMFTNKEQARREIGFPLIGRTTTHQGGSGITIINNRRELAGDNRSSHWMELIDIDREYRIHVVNNEVIAVQLKVENEAFDGTPDRQIRNLHNGWRFSRRDLGRVSSDIKSIGVNAVTALGLNFGAVDIIIDSRRNIYVLEINSAPALDIEGTLFTTYVDNFEVFFRGEEQAEEVETEIEQPTSSLDVADFQTPSQETVPEFDEEPANNRIRRAQSSVSLNKKKNETKIERIANLLEEAVKLLRS